jgi:integrase
VSTRFPGVQRIGDGRYRLRLQRIDIHTGRTVDVQRTVHAKSAEEANRMRDALILGEPTAREEASIRTLPTHGRPAEARRETPTPTASSHATTRAQAKMLAAMPATAPAASPTLDVAEVLLPRLLMGQGLDLGAVDVSRLVKALQSKRRPIPTLEAYVVDSWLPSKLPTLKKSTRDHYAWVFDARVLPVFGSRALDSIDRAEVLAWRNAVPGVNASKNSAFRVLRAMFRDAAAELDIQDPTQRIRALPEKRASGAKVLSATELAALLDAAREVAPKYYALILTLASTGARWGAVSALTWADLDFDARTLRIEKAQYDGVVDTTKTGHRRTLAMTEELAVVLEARREEMQRAVAPARLRQDTLVFPSRAGTHMQPSTIRDALLAASVRAGLAEGVYDDRGRLVRGKGRVPSAHWFRYTLNDLLRRVASGEVQRAITGHTTVAMSEHYSHVDVEEKRVALGRVWETVSGRREASPGTPADLKQGLGRDLVPVWAPGREDGREDSSSNRP